MAETPLVALVFYIVLVYVCVRELWLKVRHVLCDGL